MAFKFRKKRKNENKGFRGFDFELEPETKKGIISIFLFALGAICLLSFWQMAGDVGSFINDFLKTAFGWGYFLVPIILIIFGYLIINFEKYEIRKVHYLGLFLFIISLCGLLHIKFSSNQGIYIINEGGGGGYLGLVISYPLQEIMGFWASAITLAAVFLVSLLLMFNSSLTWIKEKINFILYIFVKVKNFIFIPNKKFEDELNADDEKEKIEKNFGKKEISEIDEKKVILAQKKAKGGAEKESDEIEIIPNKKLRYKVEIPLNLLNDKAGKPTSGDIKLNSQVIQKTLENFNIPVEMGEVRVGPTVTQFTLKPADGIKLSRITALNNDLALSLAAHPIRIEAPIPGKSLIGVEVPNKSAAIVRLREILESKSFKTRESNLTVALGIDVSGQAWTARLDRMPHLLVAGATGSGKSVCLNSIVVSLLYQNDPDILKFVFVDPKRVELTNYNGIPYLLTPVITDVKKTINALKWLISEMDRRYDKLSKMGKRNIITYNETAEEKMPYIVVVIDELADLMVAAASEMESCIVRLAQMARAVGIHLVLATQRPSVDVITGLIKANITSRIAFSVASLMDSRTILDCSGAEKLVGRGDMLYISADLSKPVRLQGAYLSDNEIRKVVDYLRNNFGEPEFAIDITAKQFGTTNFDFDANGDDDELVNEAKELIVKSGKASASFLQRKLKVGYARAARLLDLLEEQGIIGPAQGAKPREILVTELYEEDLPADETNSTEEEQKEEEFEAESHDADQLTGEDEEKNDQ